jgi:DNA repair/transcription protein MET18/MMS19
LYPGNQEKKEMDLIPWAKAIDVYVTPASTEEEHSTAINSVLLAIHKGTSNMLSLIEDLGPYLTTPENAVRSRATFLIAEVLRRLPNLKLNAAAVSVLCEFFIDRMTDAPCTAQVISGLHALATNQVITGGKEIRMIRTFFSEIQVQAQAFAVRASAYEFLRMFVAKFPQTVQSLAREFVYGVIQAVDAERDPRNLQHTFALLHATLVLVPDAAGFADEIVDIASSYFPITFKPRPGDSSEVTAESLSAGLRCAISPCSIVLLWLSVADSLRSAVLTAAPVLAPLTIPFLLDRLLASPDHKVRCSLVAPDWV